MNKYQEALNRLKSHIPYYSISNNHIVEIDREVDLELIQELVNKETPMKPRYNSNYPSGDCPICRNNIGDNPRCRCCGQKIDWSEDE